MTTPVNLSRRLFLVRGAQMGAGLTLGMSLSPLLKAADGYTGATAKTSGDLQANAFVSIRPDNRVIITIKHLEMGQGTFTGLATIAAEELDAAWEQVESVHSPVNTKLYSNTFLGVQITGGSTGIANSWQQMREAGAAARLMLVQAAAREWDVPVAEITTNKGEIFHQSSGRTATYGHFSEAASLLPVPEKIVLKDPKDFTLIGNQSLARKDWGKTNGSAIFTLDVQLPHMVTALVLHPPVPGATVKSVEAAKAEAMPGVLAVLQIPTGVAVLAQTFWQAKQARDALVVAWDEGQYADFSSEALLEEYHQLATRPGTEAANKGDAQAALQQADKVVEAGFTFPYLAHAALEPLDCVIQRTPGGAEMWFASQSGTTDQIQVANILGLNPEQVTIHVQYAGGSFGRRGGSFGKFGASDYVAEAATIAKAYDRPVPIKLVWTREDDMRGYFYRPAYVHNIQATLDKEGRIHAWRQRIVGQSIMGKGDNEVDFTSVEGAANLPYAIPNLRVESRNTTSPVIPQFWRAVGSTHTAYAVETLVDELARAAGKDPVAFRLSMLEEEPRHRTVLELAAEKSAWGQPLPEGRYRGVALHKSFGSYVAQVAEIARQANGKYKVVKVTCAVDCGVAVNPDVVRAQMEGGIGYGLSPLMFSEITLEKGRVTEGNFDSYPVIRMQDMPEIDVHIVPSAESPTGVGEPGTPVVMPAVANALATATGERFYRLPIGKEFFA